MDIKSALLYIDSAILALNKPAGLPTLPDGYNRDAPCLVNLLKAEYPAVWTVHRLDKDTSGVIVFARSAGAHRHLNAQFEGRNISKVYHALVNGRPQWDEKTVTLRLRSNGDRHHRTVVDVRRGKEAVTELHVLKQFTWYALIEARPRTGRAHQIRAHLAAIGHPIVGDELYRYHPHPTAPSPFLGEGENALILRTALHAWSLEFDHPVSEKRIFLQAPYPQDFQQALDRSPR